MQDVGDAFRELGQLVDGQATTILGNHKALVHCDTVQQPGSAGTITHGLQSIMECSALTQAHETRTRFFGHNSQNI